MRKNMIFEESINLPGNAWDTVRHIISIVEKAEKMGWENLSFTWGEYGLDLWGDQPLTADEIEKRKERRRKQYERLKKEFGEENAP